MTDENTTPDDAANAREHGDAATPRAETGGGAPGRAPESGGTAAPDAGVAQRPAPQAQPPAAQQPAGQHQPTAQQPQAAQHQQHQPTAQQPHAAQHQQHQPTAQQPHAAQHQQHQQHQPTAQHQPTPQQPHADRPHGAAFVAPAAGSATGSPASPYAAPAGQQAAPATKRRRPGAGLLIAGLAIGALVGGAAGAGTSALIAGSSSGGTVETTQQQLTVNDTNNVTPVTAIAAKASPSVVTLSVSGGQSAGSGSGVVIDDEGHILTNNHVVTLDGSIADPQIQVTMADGTIAPATIVGTDPLYDLAVIKVEDVAGLQPIEFADSDELNVGDTAVAIGAPLGLAGSVTDGIVSALNRSIQVSSSAVPDDTGDPESEDPSAPESPFEGWGFDIPGREGGQQSAEPAQSVSLAVIQTDAAINHGNSGGALVDGDGNLIGINVAIASAGGESSSGDSGSIGVGFAINANIADRIASEIIESGSASHGLLGAGVVDSSADPESTVAGALLRDVNSGGAAADAGLRAGDIVTSFDGKPISTASDLTAQVRAVAAGSTVEIRYTRGGEAGSVEATVGAIAD